MALCASWRPGTELFVSPDSLSIAELFALGTVLLAQEATCLNVLIGGDAVTSGRGLAFESVLNEGFNTLTD